MQLSQQDYVDLSEDLNEITQGIQAAFNNLRQEQRSTANNLLQQVHTSLSNPETITINALKQASEDLEEVSHLISEALHTTPGHQSEASALLQNSINPYIGRIGDIVKTLDDEASLWQSAQEQYCPNM